MKIVLSMAGRVHGYVSTVGSLRSTMHRASVVDGIDIDMSNTYILIIPDDDEKSSIKNVAILSDKNVYQCIECTLYNVKRADLTSGGTTYVCTYCKDFSDLFVVQNADGRIEVKGRSRGMWVDGRRENWQKIHNQEI